MLFRAASLIAILLTAKILLTPAALAEQPPVVLAGLTNATPALRPALRAADADLAAPLREAHRTLTQVRKQFQLGLRVDDALFVAVRVLAADTAFRLVQARVLGWHDGTVQALVPATQPSTQEPDADSATPLAFPESAVLDWTLHHADGRVEGNFLGRHHATTERAGTMELR